MAAPNTLSGLHAWWKADSLVLANGAAVASWADSGSGGFTATQATAGLRPTYVTNVVNGLPVVRFTGGAARFLVSGASSSLTDETIFVVLNHGGRAIEPIRATSGDGGVIFQVRAGIMALSGQNTGIRRDATTVTNATNFFVQSASHTTAATAFYVNGAAAGSGIGLTPTAGRTTVIGADPVAAAEYVDGDIAELIVYNRVLTTAERATVHSYLQDRYAITVADYTPDVQSVAPTSVASPQSVPSPTVDATPRLFPPAVPSAAAVSAPTVVPGTVTLTPSATDPAQSVAAPTVAQVILSRPVASPRTVSAPSLEQAIRPPLRIDFWALDDAGNYLCPLPHPVSWDLSLEPGSSGAVKLTYPRDGLNFSVLHDRITRNRDLYIRIRVDGTNRRSLGAILSARDGDEVAESSTVTFLGAFNTARLKEAVLAYDLATEKGETYYEAASAGRIMRLAMQAAQARGTLHDLTWTFTDTVDSNGQPWTTQTSIGLPPGRTYLQIITQLSELGMCEFEVTTSFELRMYVADTVGTNHTLTDPPLVLRRGRDLQDAPRRLDVGNAATDLLVAGDENIYVKVFDATARARRGRQVEQYESQGNITDFDAAVLYAQVELGRRAFGVEELTYSLTFDQDRPAPLRELYPGDRVFTDTGSGLGSPERIVQITVSQQAGEDRYSGGVVLRDLIADRDVAVQRQIDGLAGGQLVTGVSIVEPDVDDGIPPPVPTGLQVQSRAYYDGGTPLALLTASWLPVIDIHLSGYEVQFRYQAGQGLDVAWQVGGFTSGLSITWSPLVSGKAVDVRVRAYDRFDRESAFSAPVSLTTASDALAPPAPATPVVTSYLGILAVEWDGLGSAGEAMPGDFSHVEVHVSTTNSFTADRPGNSIEGSTTYADRLTGPGTLPIAVGTYGVTFFARLVAVDRTRPLGNASPQSAQGSAVLVQAGDGDVSTLSIGKLTVGIMSAIMTISGIIRTASSGARVELDSTGLRCIAANGTVLLEFAIPTSLLSIVGRLVAGAGIGLGPTVVVDPGVAGIDFYPSATTQRTRMRARSTARGDGTTAAGFALDTLNSSGQTDGFAIDAWSSNAWFGHKLTSGLFAGARLILEGNGLAGIFAYPPGGGTAQAQVQVAANGQVAITANGQASITGAGSAQLLMFSDGSTVQLRADVSNRLLVQTGLNPKVGLFSSGEVAINGAGDQQLLMVSGGNTVQLKADVNNRLLLNTSGGGQLIIGGTVKSFVVDHPLDDPDHPRRWLVHGCTESPVPGVEYAGTAVIADHLAVVELPSYFEALCEAEGRTVHLTPELTTSEGMAMVPSAAPSPVVDGRFHIVCPAPDGTRVHWLVKATRRNAGFDVEPLRVDVDPHGDGPYRYLTPRTV